MVHRPGRIPIVKKLIIGSDNIFKIKVNGALKSRNRPLLSKSHISHRWDNLMNSFKNIYNHDILVDTETGALFEQSVKQLHTLKAYGAVTIYYAGVVHMSFRLSIVLSAFLSMISLDYHQICITFVVYFCLLQ